MIGALLISTFMINSTFAYTQIESDATTGPAFDITDTQNSEITNTCNDTDCDAASNIEYASAGDLLGTFKITGYCDYNNCSDATSLTASGTTPIADHTISADWSILPKGTKVLTHEQQIMQMLNERGVSMSRNYQSNGGMTANEMDGVMAKHFAKIQTNTTNIDRKEFSQWVGRNGNKTIQDNNRVSRTGFKI